MLKSLNIGDPCLGVTPYFETNNFCLVYFVFDIYQLQNFDLSSFSGLKVQKFGGPVWGEPPILIPPNFVKFDFFVISAYSKNFMCLA